MYRTVFTPSEIDNIISFNIPNEWYGRNIEVIAFPLDLPETPIQDIAKNKFKAIPQKYLFDTKNFKFNRDEANDYE